MFVGNLVKQCGVEDEEIQIPYADAGRIHVATNSKLFAQTKGQLPMGMCGGPAINENGECIGVTGWRLLLHNTITQYIDICNAHLANT